MTVEIIIASVIAFSIAFFLMEITMKLVDVTDNEYADTNFMTDKALIITNVKKYVEDYLDDVKSDGDPRVNFTCSGNKCTAQSESNAYLGLYIQNNSIIVEHRHSSCALDPLVTPPPGLVAEAKLCTATFWPA